MVNRSFFVAATGQNVGKTTVCLGLVAALQKRGVSVGFLKPVGQTLAEDLCVDKDVVLFKDHFGLKEEVEAMSPVLFPRGFTRDYLDGKVKREELIQKILASYQSVSQGSSLVIVEGTGHTGVGSIVDLNNAQVASLLKCPMILVAQGGLGSSFDELFLNFVHCQKYDVPIAGVILNRVLEEKRSMIIEYMGKALSKWNVPLLGCIPFDPLLSAVTLFDLEQLFQPQWIHKIPSAQCHFRSYRVLSTVPEVYQTLAIPKQLLILPASQEALLAAVIQRYWDAERISPQNNQQQALLLTGKAVLDPTIQQMLQQTTLPILQTPCNSFTAAHMIAAHTSKIRHQDTEKIREAIRLIEHHIDFTKLLTC